MEQNNTVADNNGFEFQALQKYAGFEIAPCEETLQLENHTEYKKIELSPAEKRQFTALLEQLPMAVSTGAVSQLYTVKFPDGLPHTLTALQQGGYGSMVRVDGKFAGSASFYEASSQAAVMGAFTTMSLATGQYFMSQINNELKMLNKTMDHILEFLYGDKKAELLSEIAFVKYAYQNYGSIMKHEQQRLATLISLQSAKKVAMKDIEFYLNDLDFTVKESTKNYDELEQLMNKAFQICDSLELSRQLHIMSGLMEAYYAQNMDEDYIHYLEEEMKVFVDKCDKRILVSLSHLRARISDYKKPSLKKIDKTINENKISDIIDSLNNGKESALCKTIHAALHAPEQTKEIYIQKNGVIYLKNA